MGGEVTSMRGLVLAIGALVIVAGCGHLPGGQVTAGDYKLYEAVSQKVSVIDSRAHSVERNLPLGTPSPDWMHLYTVSSSALLDLDPQTGTTLHTLALPGGYQLPPATLSGVPGGLSQDGRWLVLEAFDTTSTTPSATHLLLIDTSYAMRPQPVDLKGFFNFDAISNDGRRVYLIQYVSSTEYYVRQFDVGIGQLNPTIIFDKLDGGAAMAGLRLSGVVSPDGQMLYSVYVRPNKSAFIHALSLDGNLIAYCIDLPGSADPAANGDAEFQWSLALSPDGNHLYAANGAMGIVADVSTGGNGPPSITRTAHIAKGQPASSGAAVSPDGGTLVMSGDKGIEWVDTTTLRARDSALAGWTVRSLAMSPDGTTVYAIDDAGMIAELSMTGTHSATTFGGAPGLPMALLRVAAAPGS